MVNASPEVTVAAVHQVGFGVYSEEEIRKLSVKKIVNPVTVDQFGNYLPDGLYDPALGPHGSEHGICQTCQLKASMCPGHFGHIDLPVPVYNPLLLKELFQLLKGTCLHCNHLRITTHAQGAHIRKLRLLHAGQAAAAAEVGVPRAAKKKKAPAATDGDDVDEIMDEGEEQALDDNKAREEPPEKVSAGSTPPVTSNVLGELQEATKAVFASINNNICPHCKHAQAKVKRAGKSLFSVEPLSAKKATKNASLQQNGEGEVGNAGNRGSLLAHLTGPNPIALEPSQVRDIMRAVWELDGTLLSLIYPSALGSGGKKGVSPDMFFLQALLVSPNRFRPFNEIGGTQTEHEHNVLYVRILKACLDINDLKSRRKEMEDRAMAAQPQGQAVDAPDAVQMYMRYCRGLQNGVNALIDSSTAVGDGAPNNLPGVRQLLEKKEGLFRMNMMGKRVNFACRSVISPDPNIGTGEIGLPPLFALRLSYPEYVTPHNAEFLRKLVMNGPKQYPGAVAVEDTATGRVSLLQNSSAKQREAISRLLSQSQSLHAPSGRGRSNSRGGMASASMHGKIVYRHVLDGDVLLTNRQPTLHKPGVMAHYARVLEGERTIRMHYANCATFNADFDGDEINLHLPQTCLSRAEGYGIVHADHQFKVPTDGKPVRGLIQDHVIAAVLLTKRDTFLTRNVVCMLLSLGCASANRERIMGNASAPRQAPRVATGASKGIKSWEEEPVPLPVPAVLKPRPMWTGKQVISALVAYHTRGMTPPTYTCGTKVTAQVWGKDSIGSEAQVHMRRGYVCHGTFDKAQYATRGLLHTVQELYGGPVAGELTSGLSRLLTTYIQLNGFTCGMGDLLLTPHHEKLRTQNLLAAEGAAVSAGATVAGVELPPLPPGTPAPAIRAAEHAVRSAMRPKYRQSALVATTHDQQVSSALNPVASEVTRGCFPAGLQRPFMQNCMTLMTSTGAKGGLVNFSQITAMLGQQDLEGRRVPIMASGKTLPCFLPFDCAARSGGFIADRFLTGLRPQEYYFHCMAGRDGLVDTAVKTARSGYLQRCMIKNLETLAVAYDGTVRDGADGAVVQFVYGEDGLDVLNTSYLHSFPFLQDNATRLAEEVDLKIARKVKGCKAAAKHASAAWAQRIAALDSARADGSLALDTSRKAINEFCESNGMACMLAERPPSDLGVLSEAFGDALGKFMNKSGIQNRKEFETTMFLRYMRGLAAPGESAGILAGQSIGEPSTQMTLNTFHMAGRGEANVTLGIPRLRELLMTAAAESKTPVMTLPLRRNAPEGAAEGVAAKLRKLRLAECLKGLRVEEEPFCEAAGGAGEEFEQSFTIHLQFHPMADYSASTQLKWQELVAAVEGSFIKEIAKAISKQLRRARGSARIVTQAAEDVPTQAKDATADDKDGEGGGEGADADERDADHNALAMAGEAGADNSDDENKEDNEEFAEAKEDRGDVDYDDASDDDGEGTGKRKQKGENVKEEPDGNVGAADGATADVTAVVGDKKKRKSRKRSKQEEVEEEAEGDTERASKAARTTDKSTPAASTRKLIGADVPAFVEEFREEARCEVNIRLPLTAPKVLMGEISEAAAVATLVRATPGISSVYVVPPSTPGAVTTIQTDGINFQAAWGHEDVLDLFSATCNDVMHTFQVFGIEAARASLVTEVRAVFGAYGISVDARHLSLIADFMTRSGGYRGCSRHGIATCTSPLLKMSFETSATFLKEAALKGNVDSLGSAASKIVLGQPVGLGTGTVAVLNVLKAEA